MTTAEEIKKPLNRVYKDVFIKRRLPTEDYESEWLDVSRHVDDAGLNQITYAIDSTDYDVGIFSLNNVRMKMNNYAGKWNDPSDPRSFWAGFPSRHLTKVKIEAGYLDENDDKITEQAFLGFLDERALEITSQDSARATILARESVFDTLEVTPGSLSSSVKASEAIFILVSRGEIKDHMTVSQSKINPANDITIDDPGAFESRKLKAVLNEILLLTNSVLYIDSSDNLVVSARTATRKIKWDFYLNAENGKKDNIYSVRNFSSGRHRVKNHWVWSDTSIVSKSKGRHLTRYGVTRKSLSSDAVTTTATRQSILDDMRNEWEFPKQELTIETDYLANEIRLLDTVRLNVRPQLSRQENLPICGHAKAGEARAVAYASGLRISDLLGFKVLQIDHDLRRFTTKLKLREKGTGLTDGYLEMVITSTYDVIFSGETQKDIDTSGEEIDAERAMVEVTEPAADGATEKLGVTRPTSTTIRLTSGVAISKTFKVLVVEVKS